MDTERQRLIAEAALKIVEAIASRVGDDVLGQEAGSVIWSLRADAADAALLPLLDLIHELEGL